jgi:alkyldihydroxyacetonephosphate synthase
VVPFGGGTSVVGGLAARREGFAGVVALDLARLDELVSIDPQSHTVELQAGLRGPGGGAGRALVSARSRPQSFEYASIGGFAATGPAGRHPPATAGSIRLWSASVATPLGIDLVVPASAAGPDLREPCSARGRSVSSPR